MDLSENKIDPIDPYIYHRFLDEAGDTAFFGKGKINIIGNEGVSKSFILGMVKFKKSLTEIRQQVTDLHKTIADDPYFKEVPSIQK
jgi:hypothetical protein